MWCVVRVECRIGHESKSLVEGRKVKLEVSRSFCGKDIKEGSEFLFNALILSCGCPRFLGVRISGPVTPAAKDMLAGGEGGEGESEVRWGDGRNSSSFPSFLVCQEKKMAGWKDWMSRERSGGSGNEWRMVERKENQKGTRSRYLLQMRTSWCRRRRWDAFALRDWPAPSNSSPSCIS